MRKASDFISDRQVLPAHFQQMNLNNSLRIRRFLLPGSSRAGKAYLIIPVLLQFNDPNLVGYIEDEDTPFGITGFRSSSYLDLLTEYAPGLKARIRSYVRRQDPVVESLLLIGSAGTIAQTSDSDLDYWVCLDFSKWSAHQLELLNKKLAAIQAWMEKSHALEVNFYPVDINQIDQAPASGDGKELDGLVAPLILRDEFYRTVLHVAGRAPLWWAMPPGIAREEYLRLKHDLEDNPQGVQTAHLDLGYPARPAPQELLNAALWLSQKSSQDPFKGAIKLVLLHKQIQEGDNFLPTCESVKKRILETDLNPGPVDPYETVMEIALEHGDRHLEEKFRSLLHKSVYFKIKGLFGAGSTEAQKLKENVLSRWIRKWTWTEDFVERLSRYADWPEQEKLDLGRRMKVFLFHIYSNIAASLKEKYPDSITDTEENLLYYKAKLISRFSGHSHKIEQLPSSVNLRTMSDLMTVFQNGDIWQLYGGHPSKADIESETAVGALFHQTNRAARLMAWLVYNRMINPDTKIKLIKPSPVSLDAIWELIRALDQTFGSLETRVSKEGQWRQGGVGPRFIVVNFENAFYQDKLAAADIIYQTAWGEMRHQDVDFGHLDREAEKYVNLSELLVKTGRIEPVDLHIFLPPGLNAPRLEQNLRIALNQGLLARRHTPPGQGRSKRSLRLDTD